MRHIICLFLTIFIVINSLELNAQSKELELYKSAYEYLNDSIIKIKYPDHKAFAKNCRRCCVKGKKLNFESDLQIAEKFIENNRGFPISDFATKKYKFEGDCLRAIRMGSRECEQGNTLRDSLELFWKEYKMQDRSEIRALLSGLISERKDGFQVFFSDVYKNTLSAEIMPFCLPYDEVSWMGGSTMFFFVFNEKAEIMEIYSERTIHYN